MLLPFKGFSPQAYVWKTAQDSFKDNFRFQPDQRCADAKVDADAKAEVTSLVASNFK